ncbi:hypothetical protein EVAR_42562_1 [Eumeta japonica]|uniref:Uncharacterized protein n=1 Tax=Eumeta variegata TaxID=151549 RepID=A0A4C1WTD5_EUMVA|nr:hypothetical protein EVAR_42562_1 [Eumeta japonica]
MSDMIKILISILRAIKTGQDPTQNILEGPDPSRNILNLRILYWNPGGIIGKNRELRDLTQLENIHYPEAGRHLMEDTECQGYDNPTHVPTDPRHRPDVLDIELGHKTFLETLYLGFSFATAEDVDASANLLVDKIREAQFSATTLLSVPTSRRRNMPLSIKTRLRRKRRLLKLWTRIRSPKLKSELNELARVISEAVRYFCSAIWKVRINWAVESSKNLNQLCRQLTKATAPICPVTDRAKVRRYDIQARAEVIVDYLVERFSPNLPATSPPLVSTTHNLIRAKVPLPIPELYASYTNHISTLRAHLEKWEDNVLPTSHHRDGPT